DVVMIVGGKSERGEDDDERERGKPGIAAVDQRRHLRGCRLAPHRGFAQLPAPIPKSRELVKAGGGRAPARGEGERAYGSAGYIKSIMVRVPSSPPRC